MRHAASAEFLLSNDAVLLGMCCDIECEKQSIGKV